MLTLGEKQRLFARLLGEFLVWIYEEKYEVTIGEVERLAAQATANAASGAGISNSLHLLSLAVDLHLFIAGVWQKDTPAYKPLGDKWKSMHPLCCWGGDFTTRPDGNHFSITHDGRK